MVKTQTPATEIVRPSLARAEVLKFIEPLALPGVLVAVIYAAGLIMGAAGVLSERFKFVEYGLIGATLAFTFLYLASGRGRPWLIGGAACAVLIACAEYAAFASDGFCVLCAVLQVGAMARLGWLHGLSRALRVTAGTFAFLIALAAWTTAEHLAWWTDFGYIRLSIPYFRITFGIVLTLTMLVCYARSRPERLDVFFPKWRRVMSAIGGRLVDGAVLVVIALASLRTTGLLNVDPHQWQSFHHWGVFVAPVEMVRQGGTLLWDVPSQYGFLSVLFLAALPFRSIWTELHVVISAFQTVAAFGMYACLTALLPRHTLRKLIAAASTVATVFVMSCYGIVFGPQVMPSTTAFRFVWVYVVLGVIALICGIRRPAGFESRTDPRGWRGQRRLSCLLAVACFIWTLGVFWSYESAYWVSVVWLPAFGLILWQEHKRGMPTKRLVRLASMPVVFLAVAVAVIEMVYRTRWGHGPDWSCYNDYVRAFSTGFGEMAMNYQGPIWVVFVCCLIPATVALARFRQSALDPSIPVFVGASAAVFAMASYCIGRSHVNNIINILPICFVAAAAGMRPRVTDEDARRSELTIALLARTCVIPFLAVVTSASIGIPTMARAWVDGTVHPGAIAVDARLPHFDAEATALLTRAGVDNGTPLAVYDLNLPRLSTGSTAEYLDRPFWTPISPCGAVTPLPQDRAERYIARFAARTHRGGWLLIPRKADFEGFYIPWVMPSLSKFYVPAKTLKSPRYTLIYFAPRSTSSITAAGGPSGPPAAWIGWRPPQNVVAPGRSGSLPQ